MQDTNSYMLTLEQLVRLRDAGSLSEAEFTQERANLLNMHNAGSSKEPTSVRIRRMSQGGGATFFLTYVLFMIPTYVLPYFGSNSVLANGLWSALGQGLLPQFWLHALALYVLIVICWVRGTRIETPWLAVFPVIATLFDLVPTLNWIPLVPTACHIAALVIGVSRPAVTGRPMTKIVVGTLGFLAIAAFGLIAPSLGSITDDSETNLADLSVKTDSSELAASETLVSDSSYVPEEDFEGDDTSRDSNVTVPIAVAPAKTSVMPTGDSLDVATLKALNSSQAVPWSEGDRYGIVTPGSLAEITGGVCRTVLVADQSRNRSEEATWCRNNRGVWAER